MPVRYKICNNCGSKFVADINTRKYCSLGCRKVAPGVDMVGHIYGWLTIIKEIERGVKSGKPVRRFICQCKCGKEVVKTYDGVKHKGIKTPSCGCFMHWFASNRIKHGMSKTKIYHVWESIKVRCNKKSDPSYINYGAKGISICERWKKFENFYEDMGSSYKEGLSIDRYPNKNGNYQIDNCRWATIKEQNRNLTTNRIITVFGVSKCVSEFVEMMGFKKGIITGRLNLGWSDENAVLGKEGSPEYLNNISVFNKAYLV
jgi:hypothetical protein